MSVPGTLSDLPWRLERASSLAKLPPRKRQNAANTWVRRQGHAWSFSFAPSDVLWWARERLNDLPPGGRTSDEQLRLEQYSTWNLSLLAWAEWRRRPEQLGWLTMARLATEDPDPCYIADWREGGPAWFVIYGFAWPASVKRAPFAFWTDSGVYLARVDPDGASTARYTGTAYLGARRGL